MAIETIISDKNAFIGIISSYCTEYEFKPLKKYAIDYFNNDKGFVYICSNSLEIQRCKYSKTNWGLDLEYLIEKGRLIIIYRDNYLKDDTIDVAGLLEEIEKSIDKLIEMGCVSNLVYITIDSFWNFIGSCLWKEKDVYSELKSMTNKGNTGFILRYIMEEFNANEIYNLLNIHDYILLDMVDDFEMYTSKELVHKALTLLSQFNALNDKHKQEARRMEYFKNLGEVAEGTIHDINNLLITILGYAQLSTSLEDIKEIKEYLDIIIKTALDGRIITDRIKSYMKGSYESLKEIHEFNSIINNCIEMTRHKFKSAPIENGEGMELVVDLNSQGCIYANEYDIRHSIINIILNGVDAMEGVGVLTIRTYNVEDQIVLEISDTGKGMDNSIKNKIFEPYFTTKGTEGTGLGLNIVKKTFDRHNGKIFVETEIGEGTKFTIFFPAIEVKDGIAISDYNSYNIN